MQILSLADSATFNQQLDLDALRKLLHHDDWSQLTDQEFSTRYISLCESLELDYRQKPIEFIQYPEGRTGPYIPARTSFAMAARRRLSTGYIKQQLGRDEITVWMSCSGFDPETGETRTVVRSGTVALRGRQGQDRCNGMMHAETKASRRAILAWLGLGFLDESEAIDIDGAERITGDDIANALADDDPETVRYGELVHFKMEARKRGWRRPEWLTLLRRYGWKHEGAIRRAMLSEVLAALDDKELHEELSRQVA